MEADSKHPFADHCVLLSIDGSVHILDGDNDSDEGSADCVYGRSSFAVAIVVSALFACAAAGAAAMWPWTAPASPAMAEPRPMTCCTRQLGPRPERCEDAEVSLPRGGRPDSAYL
ncbi:MAG: hypothetical protein D6773_01145, partial [Alphaproteobacteria bacterium]